MRRVFSQHLASWHLSRKTLIMLFFFFWLEQLFRKEISVRGENLQSLQTITTQSQEHFCGLKSLTFANVIQESDSCLTMAMGEHLNPHRNPCSFGDFKKDKSNFNWLRSVQNASQVSKPPSHGVPVVHLLSWSPAAVAHNWSTSCFVALNFVPTNIRCSFSGLCSLFLPNTLHQVRNDTRLRYVPLTELVNES